MDPYARLNIRPNFQQEKLPCEAQVGDVVVLTPLKEDEFDRSKDGLASVWICIKASWAREGQNAVWARVSFDGVATCEAPVPTPPQDRPELGRG